MDAEHGRLLLQLEHCIGGSGAGRVERFLRRIALVQDHERLAALSSEVTVVRAPPSPPSSLVHARREYGVISTNVPKNATGSGPSCLNTNRYLNPTRASSSQNSRVIRIDLGTHQHVNSSALVNASNTMRAGPLMVRLATISRSDVRSTVVQFFTGPGLLSIPAFIALRLSCELLEGGCAWLRHAIL